MDNDTIEMHAAAVAPFGVEAENEQCKPFPTLSKISACIVLSIWLAQLGSTELMSHTVFDRNRLQTTFMSNDSHGLV